MKKTHEQDLQLSSLFLCAALAGGNIKQEIVRSEKNGVNEIGNNVTCIITRVVYYLC